MSDFVQLLIAGATTGSIYGLIGLTFTLIYNATKLPNFGQGEFVMLGAMFAVLFFGTLALPGYVAFPLIILCGAIVGALYQQIFVAPMQRSGAPLINQVMATIAAAIIISNLAAIVAGVRQLGIPSQFGNDALRLGEFSILPQSLAVIVVTAVVAIALWLFLTRTTIGMTILATGYNPIAAQLVGIRVSSVMIMTFGLSAAIATLAGALIAPIIAASPYMGINMAVKGFIASIVGGMSNPSFALLGGLVVGVCETLISGYVSSSLNEVITLGLMMTVLLARPNGLFGDNR